MRASVVCATFGDREWAERAQVALGSAVGQGALEALAHHEPGGTLASSRNAAAARARGDWLCFLDADDQLAPGYLDAMAEAWTTGAITTDWAPLLVPAMQRFDHAGVAVDAAPAIPAWGRPLEDVNCACIGTLVRRDLFDRVGGFREWESLEDWELWLRCVRAGAQLFPVPRAVYLATVRIGGRNADQTPYHQIRAEHLEAVGR